MAIPVGLGPGDSAAGGPCGWDVDPEGLGVCAGWTENPEALRDTALQLAAGFLWAATGRQYGVCEVTVRPMQGRLGCGPVDGYADFPVIPGQSSGGDGGPYLYGGRWYNAGCGMSCCGALGCGIVLRGPVASVTEVKIGAEVVPASAYRVDVAQGAYVLLRTDGECWPFCQDVTAAPGEDGAFTVTYGQGRELPAVLQIAAAMLACEYVKALTGGACRLPARMTSLSRQGVEVEIESPTAGDGLTGIPEVDSIVLMLNPSKRKSPPIVLSPDLPESRDRVTVWTGA